MRKRLSILAAVPLMVAALGLPANAQSDSAVNVEFLSIQQIDQGWPANLAKITEEFATTHPGSTFDVVFVPQENLTQQLQLTEAQGDLPLLYNAPNELVAELDAKGEVLDLEQAFGELGVLDKVSPGAIATVKNLYGGKFIALPFELNIEGFWYNKQIFADNGIEPPTTWDELVTAAETLSQAGIQPFSASGIQGWPITRLVGNYLFRSIGPDALQKVAAGEAKLTDPEYVAAAQAVADLGTAGYFGPGVAELDYDPAVDVFLQGDAAMFYMGSWELRDFTNPERNQIGEDNIGFFPFPDVAGGAGSSDQVNMNAGQITVVNAMLYDEASGAWLAAVADRYGSVALEDQGAISGFLVDPEPATLSPTTTIVKDVIAGASDSVTWFEQLFTPEAQSAATTNAALLVTDQMSAEDFMASVQAGLE